MARTGLSVRWCPAELMIDAAKRRCPDDSAPCDFEFLHGPIESAVESASAGVAQLSMPVMPKSMASPIRKHAAVTDSELSDGVSTFEEWEELFVICPRSKTWRCHTVSW